MKQQPEDGTRQPRASDLAPLFQALDRRAAELLERPVHLRQDSREEHGCRSTRLAFPRQRRALCVGELLTPSVGEQAVQASGEVLQMLAGARGVARALPQLLRGGIRRDTVHLFP